MRARVDGIAALIVKLYIFIGSSFCIGAREFGLRRLELHVFRRWCCGLGRLKSRPTLVCLSIGLWQGGGGGGGGLELTDESDFIQIGLVAHIDYKNRS